MDTEIKAGRPFIFTDPKELAMQIQNYFDNCDPHIVKKQRESGFNDRGETIWMSRETMTEQVPYTVTGLALHLEVSRKTLNNYRDPEHYSADIPDNIRQDLIHTLESAIQRVEAFNEAQLHKNGIANGIKFNLANNFGWVDKTVVDNNNRTVEEDLDALDGADKARADAGDEAAKAMAEIEGKKDEATGPTAQEQVVAADAPVQNQG